MDREQREHYQVVIEAKDMAGQRGGLTGSTTVNITLTDVNDNPPQFAQSKAAARTTTHTVKMKLSTHRSLLFAQDLAHEFLVCVHWMTENNSSACFSKVIQIKQPYRGGQIINLSPEEEKYKSNKAEKL